MLFNFTYCLLEFHASESQVSGTDYYETLYRTCALSNNYVSALRELLRICCNTSAKSASHRCVVYPADI